jgi:hypothetical protein
MVQTVDYLLEHVIFILNILVKRDVHYDKQLSKNIIKNIQNYQITSTILFIFVYHGSIIKSR